MKAGSKISRRQFFGLTTAAVLSISTTEALAVDTERLRLTHLRLGKPPHTRFVFWTDFHYKGDAAYAEKVVAMINGLQPEFVCFAGDLVEDAIFQEEALKFVAMIRHPVYGVAGNHDFNSHSSFALNRKVFAATGGAWLSDQIAHPAGDKVELCGATWRNVGFVPPQSDRPRILLTHYPTTADKTDGRTFAAVLAGHSHGGQVRLPFYGAVVLPRWVGRYDMGLFRTPAGPLYVNAGVGTFRVPVRMNCPPEITVVEI